MCKTDVVLQEDKKNTSMHKNASSIRMLTHFVFLKIAVFWNHLLVWKLIFMSHSNLYRQKENMS